MPIEIMILRLGWSMEEANFVNWLKKDGERVKSGEPLFTLESEKATQDVEAVDSGILRISVDGPKPGQVIKVGQVRNEAQMATKPAISPRARRLAAQLGIDPTRLVGSGRTGRIIEKDVREAAKNH